MSPFIAFAIGVLVGSPIALLAFDDSYLKWCWKKVCDKCYRLTHKSV